MTVTLAVLAYITCWTIAVAAFAELTREEQKEKGEVE